MHVRRDLPRERATTDGEDGGWTTSMEEGEGEIHGEDDASAVLGQLGAQILKGLVSCEQWKQANGRGEKEENQLRRNKGRRRK